MHHGSGRKEPHNFFVDYADLFDKIQLHLIWNLQQVACQLEFPKPEALQLDCPDACQQIDYPITQYSKDSLNFLFIVGLPCLADLWHDQPSHVPLDIGQISLHYHHFSYRVVYVATSLVQKDAFVTEKVKQPVHQPFPQQFVELSWGVDDESVEIQYTIEDFLVFYLQIVVEFVPLLSIERIDGILQFIRLNIAEFSFLNFLPEPFSQTSNESDEYFHQIDVNLCQNDDLFVKADLTGVLPAQESSDLTLGQRQHIVMDERQALNGLNYAYIEFKVRPQVPDYRYRMLLYELPACLDQLFQMSHEESMISAHLMSACQTLQHDDGVWSLIQMVEMGLLVIGIE